MNRNRPNQKPFARLSLGLILLLTLSWSLVHVNRALAIPPDVTPFPQPTIIESQIVCAADSHNSCQPGPYMEEVSLPESGYVSIAVYLEHTGYYEPNEQSLFFSPWWEILSCGPIPPDVDEIYCGTVIGKVTDPITLSIQHSGGGTSTGSHRQRYEINLCHHTIYFPVITKQAEVVGLFNSDN